MRAPAPSISWRTAFGPFLLSPEARLLQRQGAPVKLGGRALDLLIALVENAGAVVSKKDLISRVWEGVVVDEGSLRFHMFVVRKALGDGERGQRYIVNTANKGYTFVAPVERRQEDVEAGAASSVKQLPALATAIVGRDQDVQTIVAGLLQRRFISIVGTGGIGKTTVAIACAQAAAEHFEGNVRFIDLGLVSTVEMVRPAVAAAIGLRNAIADLQALATHLAGRPVLLVLDGCEHVISAAAELAEWLVRSCPFVRILATSREALRAEGEVVHRLQALAYPPEGDGKTAEAALAYPAVRLFVDRAAAGATGFELKDADAALASQLCRELDGIALAIELAAGRIEALGLRAITSHFDASVRLMWRGRRTAAPHQQTLGATLDWSYRLLGEDERRLARRLSVFAGSFSLDAALEICCFDLEKPLAIELLAGLVSKSLVNVDAGGATLRYGLLDTTKSYFWKKVMEDGEDPALSDRFADFVAAWANQQVHLTNAGADDLVGDELPNVRAALERYMSQEGRLAEAVTLAASFCQLLLQQSRLADCARWAQAALSKLSPAHVGSALESRLQGSLGQSLMFTGGDGDGAVRAFRRSIEVAEQLQDFKETLHLLNGYAVLLHWDGRYTDALSVARKAQSLLVEVDDPDSHTIVDSLMGIALHLVGSVGEAMPYFERASAFATTPRVDIASKVGFEPQIRALCGIARTLWLTGSYAAAIPAAEDAIAKARSLGHAVTHCIALTLAGTVFSYADDAERFEAMLETLERVAKQHSLIPYQRAADVARGQMLITRGRVAEGVERIRTALEILHAYRYRMRTSMALTAMARGLSQLSLHSAAISMCDQVERMIQTGGDLIRMPDLLTTRGHALAAAGQSAEAARSWLAAIDLARSQGVKSGQVKAAIALARHLIDTGRPDEADRLLRPHVVAAGDESSPDLRIARGLLS